jgi:hypothetical protein
MRKKWTLALAAIAFCISIPMSQAQEKKNPNQLEEEIKRELFFEGIKDCQPTSMLRCWYIFWGTGDTPYRKLYFADLKTRTPTSDKNLVEMDVIEVHETDNPAEKGANDYLLMTLQFRCNQNKVRVLDGYAFMFNGKIDRAPGASPWFDVPEAWYKLARRAACDKEVRLRPLAHQMLWFGSQYRPIDVVDYTRRFLWNQPSNFR